MRNPENITTPARKAARIMLALAGSMLLAALLLFGCGRKNVDSDDSRRSSDRISERTEADSTNGTDSRADARADAAEADALIMRLRRIIGSVSLRDADGEALDAEENMRLFSQSLLSTETESSAIVDMDEVKLAILDELSEASFEKSSDGSRLIIRLESGGLYFSVAEPLDSDESFDIEFSDIRLSIRSTCGIVQIEDENSSSVILASGKAVIQTTGPDAETQKTTIRAGKQVRIISDGDGHVTFERHTLTENELPSFLTESLKQDPEAVARVIEDTGWTEEAIFARQKEPTSESEPESPEQEQTAETSGQAVIPAEHTDRQLAHWWDSRSGSFITLASDGSFQYTEQYVSGGTGDGYVISWNITVDHMEQSGSHSYHLHVAGITLGEYSSFSGLENQTAVPPDPDSCLFQPGATVELVLPGASADEAAAVTDGNFDSSCYYLNGVSYAP